MIVTFFLSPGCSRRCPLWWQKYPDECWGHSLESLAFTEDISCSRVLSQRPWLSSSWFRRRTSCRFPACRQRWEEEKKAARPRRLPPPPPPTPNNTRIHAPCSLVHPVHTHFHKTPLKGRSRRLFSWDMKICLYSLYLNPLQYCTLYLLAVGLDALMLFSDPGQIFPPSPPRRHMSVLLQPSVSSLLHSISIGTIEIAGLTWVVFPLGTMLMVWGGELTEGCRGTDMYLVSG